MRARKTPGDTDPALNEQITAIREGQRDILERIEALDERLAGMESDLAVIRARLLGAPRVEPRHVAERLGLTPAQSRVAVALAEGNAVRGIAEKTGRAENTVRFHLKEIYGRLGISSQAALVRLVLLLPYGNAGGLPAGKQGHIQQGEDV